jgi:antitoxin HigA-1
MFRSKARGAREHSIQIKEKWRICFRWAGDGVCMKSKSLIITERDAIGLKRPKKGCEITRKPVHPGEMLRKEFMEPLGLPANRLAIDLRVAVTRIPEILNERRAITADTALRLQRYFGMCADFWMNLQKDYELTTARQQQGKKIQADVQPRFNARK